MNDAPLKVYFVLGEESGDKLAANLVPALQERAASEGRKIEFSGLAGDQLKALGQASLFDINDIAVMGISAVIARLPVLVRRVFQTVADIEAERPDLILLIDSPDFTHAVAKRVRKRLPNVPIINYVCPSVWAWRSGRAAKMCAYVDHVLAILPFEPRILKKLNGPAATYVGHPLTGQILVPGSTDSRESVATPILLVLPGSRRGEIKRMLQLYGQSILELRLRGVEFDAVLAAVSSLKPWIESQTKDWKVPVRIVDSSENQHFFSEARVALATSGTVTLELALHRVPMVVGYRIDSVARLFASLITTWSAVLPNLILDRVLVPEEHNEMVIPARMARYLEALMKDGPVRQLQLDGFDEIANLMQTKRTASEKAADVVFDHLNLQ